MCTSSLPLACMGIREVQSPNHRASLRNHVYCSVQLDYGHSFCRVSLNLCSSFLHNMIPSTSAEKCALSLFIDSFFLPYAIRFLFSFSNFKRHHFNLFSANWLSHAFYSKQMPFFLSLGNHWTNWTLFIMYMRKSQDYCMLVRSYMDCIVVCFKLLLNLMMICLKADLDLDILLFTINIKRKPIFCSQKS